jgi:hypothetical protein
MGKWGEGGRNGTGIAARDESDFAFEVDSVGDLCCGSSLQIGGQAEEW